MAEPHAARDPDPLPLDAIPSWRRWRAILLAAFLLLATLVGLAELLALESAGRRAEAAALARETEAARSLALATELIVARYQAVATAVARAVFDWPILASERRRILGSVHRDFPEVSLVVVADRAGRVIDASRAGAVGIDVSDRAYFRKLAARQSDTAIELVLGRYTRAPKISLAAAGRASNGALLGIVAVAVSPEVLARELGGLVSGDRYPVVIDRHGRVVVHGSASDPDWVQRDLSREYPVAEALAGRLVRSTRFADPLTGRSILGAIAPVAELGWAAGVFQPVESALAVVHEDRRRAAATVLAVLGVGLALALVLSRVVARPLAALSDGVAALSLGDLSHRVDASSRSEFGWLARRFNAMVERLAAAREHEHAMGRLLAETNEALQRRVAELQTLLDVVPIGVGVADDPQARSIRANPALARLLGVPAWTDISKSGPKAAALPFAVYRDGRELASDELPLQRSLATRVVQANVEVDVVRADGRRLHLLEWAAPFLDEQGQVRGGFLAVLDITDRKRAERVERVLAEAGAALSASLDLDETLDRVVSLVVPRLADWCFVDRLEAGAFRRSAIGHAWPARGVVADRLRRVSPDPGGTHPLALAVRTGRPHLVREVTGEWLASIAQDPDDLEALRQLAPGSWLSVPLGVRGETVGVLTLVAAESGRHYGESDLALTQELARRIGLALDNARLYREASEAARARELFIARASHELRTPLTSALGSIRLLKHALAGQRNLSPTQLVDMAARSMTGLLALINDLLDLSKLGAGEAPLELERVDLAGLVLASKEVVQPQARERGIEMRSDVPPELTVAVDPLKIVQLLTNLLANAVKFTPAGGEVLIDAAATGEKVVIRVRDTGEGLPPEDLERIFQPFAQVRRSDRPSRRGTGLGLPICREIAALHNGRIWAESDGVGLGSTFTVELPVEASGREAA